MRLKLLTLFSSLVFLGACASQSGMDSSAETDGSQVAAAAASAPANEASVEAVDTIAQDSERYFLVNVGDRVLFGYDESSISAESAGVLDRQAVWLRMNPAVTVMIAGHADERGTREYNLSLGERRANAVSEYLISQGVAEARIETVSYGKERPAVLGSNEEAWAQNRRSVTSLVSGYSN